VAKCACGGVTLHGVILHEEGCPKEARRKRVIALGAFIAAVVYITLGVGYHRTVVACYDSRHSIDDEPMVGGGPIGVVIDLVLWPVFQVADGLNGIDCHPRPVHERASLDTAAEGLLVAPGLSQVVLLEDLGAKSDAYLADMDA
jgi:hypothetical protein